eukprot:1151753_1
MNYGTKSKRAMSANETPKVSGPSIKSTGNALATSMTCTTPTIAYPKNATTTASNKKIADAGLIAKWKKPGYERLCSTYVINPANYKFGTTSICRVPMKDRGENAKKAQDPTTGCLGCASGDATGLRNIFGNKYGQNLA